jgi:hypothetical protein
MLHVQMIIRNLRLSSPLFKLGNRITVSLNGTMWSGTTTAAKYHCRTMFDDCVHGANMQATTILLNLWETATKEQRIPETFHIGADNTPKETKNSTVLCFAIYLLTTLEDTPLWRVSFHYLMVGHTHDALDRFFSRLCASLKGRNYYTIQQMFDIVHASMTKHEVAWSHLPFTWDWVEIRKHVGVEAKRLRNSHDYEVFRTHEGIFIRWKQWLTCETYSKPVHLLTTEQMRNIGRLRPTVIANSFSDSDIGLISPWLDKLQAHLAASNAADQRGPEIAWLRRILKQSEPSLQSHAHLTIDAILSDLVDIGHNRPVKRPRGSPGELPSDIITSMFPGSDVTGLPVDDLINVIGGVQEQRDGLSPCKPGDLLIVGPNSSPMSLPFNLGVLVDIIGDKGLVQWMIPGESREANFRPGRRKEIRDIFGPWHAADSVPLANLPPLPPSLISPALVIVWGFELSSEHEIPFGVFDQILACDIDVTALSISSTARGNLYRVHRQLRSTRETCEATHDSSIALPRPLLI